MGRYAQQLRRGSDRANTPAPLPEFPLAPPAAYIDVRAYGDSGNIVCQALSDCPDGADGVEFRGRITGSGGLYVFLDTGCLGLDVLAPCTPPDGWDVQARWMLSGVAQSDWSGVFNAVCS